MNDGSPRPPPTPEQEARRLRDEADVLAAQAIEAPVLTELDNSIERHRADRGSKWRRSRGLDAEAARAILAADKLSGSPDPALRSARARIEQADALYWCVVARWGDLPLRLAKKWSRKAPAGITWDADDLAGAARIGLHRGLLRYKAGKGAAPRTWAVRWAASVAYRDNSTHGDLSGPAETRNGFWRPPILRAARLDAPLLDGRGSSTKTRRLLDLISAPTPPSIENTIDLSRARAELRRRIGELPERQRIAFVRHEIDGLTLAEIGVEMGCCRERVRQMVNEAGRRLNLAHRDTATQPAATSSIEDEIISIISAHPGKLTERSLKVLMRGSRDVLGAAVGALIDSGRICRTDVNAPLSLPLPALVLPGGAR